MIPIRLEILNFLPYRSPGPLDFEGVHVACLTGQNGAGKSALLDAITWAIWGKARDGKRSDDELIYYNQNEMQVDFEFELNQQRYLIIRQRKAGKRGKSLLDLQIYDPDKQAWRHAAESSIRQTQNKINNLLRLDYDTFSNSAFLMQGKADAFTLRSPGDRKALLADILGLEQWATYERRAKEKISALIAENRVLDLEIEGLETELARRPEYEVRLADSEAQRDKIAGMLAAAETELADMTQARRELARKRRELDTLQAQIARDEAELADIIAELAAAQARQDPETLQQQIEATQTQLDELGQRETEREALGQQRETFNTEAAQRKGENTVMEAEADPIKQRIALLKEASEPLCPTCGQPLDEHTQAQLVADLNTDLENRRQRYVENRDRQLELNQQVKTLDRQLKQLDAELAGRPKLRDRLATLKADLAASSEVQVAIEKLQARKARWETSLANGQTARQQLEGEIGQYQAQLAAAEAKEQTVEGLRMERMLAEQQVGAARQQLAALDGQAKQLETKRTTRQALAEEQGLYEELRVAFGKQGVPAMIIEAAVPEIEESANALLSRMTGGRMNVRFETQRETKAGHVRETLDVNISDELGTRSYEMYSGGEAFRINFAIRIALSKLLARRAGAQLRTLVIDEGFGTQDAQGRAHLVEAINVIKDDFERILVITHIDELKDSFPVHIEVTKTSDGSTFEVV